MYLFLFIPVSAACGLVQPHGRCFVLFSWLSERMCVMISNRRSSKVWRTSNTADHACFLTLLKKHCLRPSLPLTSLSAMFHPLSPITTQPPRLSLWGFPSLSPLLFLKDAISQRHPWRSSGYNSTLLQLGS